MLPSEENIVGKKENIYKSDEFEGSINSLLQKVGNILQLMPILFQNNSNNTNNTNVQLVVHCEDKSMLTDKFKRGSYFNIYQKSNENDLFQ